MPFLVVESAWIRMNMFEAQKGNRLAKDKGWQCENVSELDEIRYFVYFFRF